MRAQGAWERAVAASLGLALGCAGADAFLCESDEACAQGGVSGLCQPSGYCSFPDDVCPSGQRYGGHASSSLAGTCVESEGASSSGDGTSPPITGSGTTSPTGPAPPIPGDEGPVTTTPVDGSDTGTSSGSLGDEATATTGAPAETVCWLDEFDDGVIDPEVWCTHADPGVTVDEPRGHLRFSFVPEEWPMDDDGSGWASTCEHFPLLGAVAGAELLAAPQVSPHTEAYLEVGSDDLRLGMGVLDGELYAFVWNGTGYAGVDYQPYDPVEHRFLRVSGTDEGLVAETSADAKAWVHVYTEAADLAGSDGHAGLGVWGEMLPLGPDEARFELFGLCWLEG